MQVKGQSSLATHTNLTGMMRFLLSEESPCLKAARQRVIGIKTPEALLGVYMCPVIICTHTMMYITIHTQTQLTYR